MKSESFVVNLTPDASADFLRRNIDQHVSFVDSVATLGRKKTAVVGRVTSSEFEILVQHPPSQTGILGKRPLLSIAPIRMKGIFLAEGSGTRVTYHFQYNPMVIAGVILYYACVPLILTQLSLPLAASLISGAFAVLVLALPALFFFSESRGSRRRLEKLILRMKQQETAP